MAPTWGKAYMDDEAADGIVASQQASLHNVKGVGCNIGADHVHLWTVEKRHHRQG